MESKVITDDQTFQKLQQSGEVKVMDSHGVPIVLMTIDARQQLGKMVYDDSEWAPEEMMGVLAQQLKDPEGWGHPDMDVYDEQYGHLFDDDKNGQDQ